VSYSWFDPHFAALYARREEERLVEQLVSCLYERAASEPSLETVGRYDCGWLERGAVLRRGHLRLL
jgi:hypothetical protein